jgi:hypothetical protein
MMANPGPERSLTVSNGLSDESHEGHPIRAIHSGCLELASAVAVKVLSRQTKGDVES